MPRITANEAAILFGVSADTILRRIKLHRLVGAKDNRGKWWVTLPDDESAAPEESEEVRGPNATPHEVQPAEPKPENVVPLETLTGMIERMERQYQQAIGLLVERVDAAELRAERFEDLLRETLEHQRRPWWRRWLGR